MLRNRTIHYFSALVKKLPQLSSKEKYVLINRLKTFTLEGIGKEFEVTEGRIRQIEKMALKKVKNKNYQQRLFKESL